MSDVSWPLSDGPRHVCDGSQVGERSRQVYPAGLLTRTLADAVGKDVAMDLYLTEATLTGTKAHERRLVQAVVYSVTGAKRLVSALAHQYAKSIGQRHEELQADLWTLSGDSRLLERRVLAADAFAQARSLQRKVAGHASTADEVCDVVFTSSDTLTRGCLRKAVQAALLARGLAAHDNTPRWTDVDFTAEETMAHTSEDALRQLLQMLAAAQDNQARYDLSADQETAIEAPVEKRLVGATQLAARFIDTLSGSPDATPLDVLVRAYESLPESSSEHATNSSASLQDGSAPLVVDDRRPCLLLLRRCYDNADTHVPLVVAHSLLGDHRGYGRLLHSALQKSAIYVLQHRGLAGVEAFALDDDGEADMVSEYASALAATFVTESFDIIGASFGAVLASHVWHAAKMAKGYPQRLVCIVCKLQEPGTRTLSMHEECMLMPLMHVDAFDA